MREVALELVASCGAGVTSSQVPYPRGWHTLVLSANSESRRVLALGQAECQSGGRPLVDVAQIAWLQTAAGSRLLDEAAAALGHDDELTVAERLRRAGGDAADVAAAMTQVRLRRRAAAKLGAVAERLLFTPEGLEQATHPTVAGL